MITETGTTTGGEVAAEVMIGMDVTVTVGETEIIVAVALVLVLIITGAGEGVVMMINVAEAGVDQWIGV